MKKDDGDKADGAYITTMTTMTIITIDDGQVNADDNEGNDLDDYKILG